MISRFTHTTLWAWVKGDVFYGSFLLENSDHYLVSLTHYLVSLTISRVLQGTNQIMCLLFKSWYGWSLLISSRWELNLINWGWCLQEFDLAWHMQCNRHWHWTKNPQVQCCRSCTSHPPPVYSHPQANYLPKEWCSVLVLSLQSKNLAIDLLSQTIGLIIAVLSKYSYAPSTTKSMNSSENQSQSINLAFDSISHDKTFM